MDLNIDKLVEIMANASFKLRNIHPKVEVWRTDSDGEEEYCKGVLTCDASNLVCRILFDKILETIHEIEQEQQHENLQAEQRKRRDFMLMQVPSTRI